MIIIGLTGGIGSGKSTVGTMFETIGVPVYNSDLRAKELMHSSKQIKQELISLFGENAFVDQELNTAYIAENVFNNPVQLAKLNAIVHPRVRADFLEWAAKKNVPYVIQETALLYENKAQDNYDQIILVTAPKELRIRRLLLRDASTQSQIMARMDNQLNDEAKLNLADYVIENIELEKTRLKVLDIHHRILADC